MAIRRQGGKRLRPIMLIRLLPGFFCAAVGGGPAWAGSVDLFGIETDYKITLGYALSLRMEDPDPALIDGPVDKMQVELDPVGPCAQPPCLGSFGHTGLPITTNFDDGNRDFKKGALLNNRVSSYGELQIKLDNWGLTNVGGVASGAAHFDQVFLDANDHDNVDSVNRAGLDSNLDRVGPINEWSADAKATNGKRHRLLEAYAYGEWYLTETIGLALRGGKHLAAWGESLFFPGIVSAQGPFDATKANVPGVEVKEILLPVNQVSMQLALTSELTVLGYNQFEFKPTEIYPEGDFFSPADLVGPGAVFGYGSINPLHDRWCGDPDRVEVSNDPTGTGLCQAAMAFENEPEYIMTVRTPDKLPGTQNQWGAGLKYQLTPNFNLGGYYLRYNNHNPHVLLNMGEARIGDDAVSGIPVTTADLGLTIPESFTIAYADNVEMTALSFSTVFWVFNIGGELIQRDNVDTSLEATILGVIAPVTTRGKTTTAQTSLLYVNNPDFLMYDEVVVVGEFAYTQVDQVNPRRNEPGICMTGTSQADCDSSTPQESGSTLFYDESSWAMQMLVLPKGRNVFPGWDIGTPISFSWLVDGTPSTPGVFGPLYGEGDMRAGISVTAQYVQNLEFGLSYNAFFGDSEKHIGRSTLKANPYVDHDYASFTVKYNL